MVNNNGPVLQEFYCLLDDNVTFHGFELSVACVRGGRHEQGDQRDQFRCERQAFLTNVIVEIEGRFPNMELLEAMQVCRRS